MKATKESAITIEMNIEEANVIIGALAAIDNGELQMLDFYPDYDEAVRILRVFLGETRSLI